MALILEIKVGSRFFVGDRPLYVTSIQPQEVQVERDDGCVFQLTDKRTVEVYPRLFMSVGYRPALAGTLAQNNCSSTRLVFEAPRDIVVLREEIYQKRQLQKTA